MIIKKNAQTQLMELAKLMDGLVFAAAVVVAALIKRKFAVTLFALLHSTIHIKAVFFSHLLRMYNGKSQQQQ